MTAAEKMTRMLEAATDKQLTETYSLAFRLWVKGGRIDEAINLVLKKMEAQMDERGMDTEAIIEALVA